MLWKHFHWNWIMLCLHLILFSIYQIDIQLNFFSWNVSHFNWHFGVIGLRITFWIFFSSSSFRTIILLLWFKIFTLLSILKPNDFFFIFSLLSDFNFLTTFSGIDLFMSPRRRVEGHIHLPLSVRLSVRPFVRSSVRPSVRSFVRSSVCPSVRSYVCPFVRSFVRPFVRLSVRPFVRPFVRPSVCPFVRSFVCPSVRLSVRPFVRPDIDTWFALISPPTVLELQL